jgi:hypothetical protein
VDTTPKLKKGNSLVMMMCSVFSRRKEQYWKPSSENRVMGSDSPTGLLSRFSCEIVTDMAANQKFCSVMGI